MKNYVHCKLPYHQHYNFFIRYETPSVWVVGLVLFLLAYCAIMAAGIWFYCKYCRGGKIIGTQTQENKIIESEIQSDQRAITYDEG